jgi:hypothetical protein
LGKARAAHWRASQAAPFDAKYFADNRQFDARFIPGDAR